MTNETTLNIKHIETEFSICDLDAAQWSYSEVIKLNKFWSGKLAPQKRHSIAQFLWSNGFLYVRFIANQTEPFECK